MGEEADDERSLFDDHATAQYLHELVQQASAGVLAAQATYLAAAGSTAAGDLFFNARAVANAAASVSRLLWPSAPWRQIEGEDAERFERRKRLVAARGPALRSLLHVPEDSLLRNRRVRDAVEHFDERLDIRLSSHDRNIVRNNVGHPNMIQFEGATEPFYLNLYDPSTTEYTILGDTLSVREVETALRSILGEALGAQDVIERRRYGWVPDTPLCMRRHPLSHGSPHDRRDKALTSQSQFKATTTRRFPGLPQAVLCSANSVGGEGVSRGALRRSEVCWAAVGQRAPKPCCRIAAKPSSWDYGHMTSGTRFHGYLSLQRRGVVALPAEVRARLHLDQPGAQLELSEREDGVLELRAALPVPADQAWFWTTHWQNRERRVDAHVAAGELSVHEDVDAFLAHVDHVAST